MKNIIMIMKCVDCNSNNLQLTDNYNLICRNCNRIYEKINNVYSMLPQALDSLKNKEMISRDMKSHDYDFKVSSDYVVLLDYCCIDTKKISSDDIVLDLACGTGRTTIKLAKRAKFVFAIDFSLESLKIVSEKLSNEKISNVLLIQADVNKLPFIIKPHFNFINASDFIQHIPSFGLREQLLENLYNFLVKDGSMSMTSYNYSINKKKELFVQNIELPGEHGKQGYHIGGIYYYNFSVEELYVLLFQSGFNIIESNYFYYSYPLFIRIINRLFKHFGIDFENLFYFISKNYAERIYFYVKK